MVSLGKYSALDDKDPLVLTIYETREEKLTNVPHIWTGAITVGRGGYTKCLYAHYVKLSSH